MSDHPKFLKVRYRVWWIVFFCIQAALLILMGATFGAGTWVYSEIDGVLYNFAWDDSSNNVFDGNNFEGDLYVCTEGCDTDYGKLAEEWCDYYDDLKDAADDLDIDDSTFDPYRTVCVMYFVLYLGMNIYVILESFAMISICVWALGMCCYWRKVNCLWLTYCCTGCMWALHYIALIGYMGITRSNFNGDCDSFPDDGVNPKLCAGSGPGLSLFILLIIPFISVFYCIVACKLQRSFGHGGLEKHFNQGNTVHQIGLQQLPQPVILDQPQYYQQPYGSAPAVQAYNVPQYGGYPQTSAYPPAYPPPPPQNKDH